VRPDRPETPRHVRHALIRQDRLIRRSEPLGARDLHGPLKARDLHEIVHGPISGACSPIGRAVQRQIGPPCGQFLLSDLPADDGGSERPRLPGAMPVPEPLAPHGMGSGIGLRRCFCHRRAQTTPIGSRKVNFRLSPGATETGGRALLVRLGAAWPGEQSRAASIDDARTAPILIADSDHGARMPTFRPRAVKELAGVPKEVRDALMERLKTIAHDPRAQHPGVRRLTGRECEYRVRQGDWRAVYTIAGQGDVDVIHVRQRREVYGP